MFDDGVICFFIVTFISYLCWWLDGYILMCEHLFLYTVLVDYSGSTRSCEDY